MKMNRRIRETGFTLLEVVVSLALMSVLMGIAFVNLNEMANPARNAARADYRFYQRGPRQGAGDDLGLYD